MKYIVISIVTIFFLALGIYALSSVISERPLINGKDLVVDGPKQLEPQHKNSKKITYCPYFSDLREGYRTGLWQVTANHTPIQNVDKLEELISGTEYAWEKAYKNHQQAYTETKLKFSGMECHYSKRRHVKGKPSNYFSVSYVVVTYAAQFDIFLDLELQAKQWQKIFVSHTSGEHVQCIESRQSCWFQTSHKEKSPE